jgi:hypothetical protein
LAGILNVGGNITQVISGSPLPMMAFPVMQLPVTLFSVTSFPVMQLPVMSLLLACSSTNVTWMVHLYYWRSLCYLI